MYYQKFINFLKEHNLYNEEVVEYWKNNRTLFDYHDEEKRGFIGCFYQYKKEYLFVKCSRGSNIDRTSYR